MFEPGRSKNDEIKNKRQDLERPEVEIVEQKAEMTP